jgi:hypothetical protein
VCTWNVPSDNSVVLGLAQVQGPVRPPILTIDGSVFSRLCGGEPVFFHGYGPNRKGHRDRAESGKAWLRRCAPLCARASAC